MEKRLGHIVPVALLFKFPTVAQLASELQPNGQKQSSPVIAVQPGGSKPPFFCVHGYNAYLHIARGLGPDRPFYGLGQHFTGRRVRRTRVEEQAKNHLKEIYAIQPRGPYYLAGHSLGGLIAFEMAQLLQNDGHEIAFLGLIDTVFPKKPKSVSGRFRHGVLNYWHALCGLSATGKIHRTAQALQRFVRWQLKVVQIYSYHMIDKTLPPELLTFYVDEILFRHKYLKDQGRYQPKPYNGRVHYFRAAQSLNDVEKWKSVTDRELVVHEIPGTHLTMIEDTGAVELARTLKSCLEEACVAPQRFSYPATYPNDAKVTLPTMVFQRTTIRR
jgi:thioesterase domain-containing protein